jgi:hypothetical protein
MRRAAVVAVLAEQSHPHAVVLSVDEKSHVWMAPGSQEKS